MATLSRVLPGLLIILCASAVLLFLDRSREPSGGQDRVAVFQLASRPVLDDTIQGALEGLAEKGLTPGKSLQVDRFNADNDLPTANSIAKQIVEGQYRLVFTASTPCLQIMGAANRAGGTVHVFAAVTDPFAAGVGITRAGHPRHLVGVGTFQPVREAFRLARQMNPGLRTVGVVWCPGESSSQACLALARDETKRMGIQLLEAPVDSTPAVGEAAQSLVARGVQAFWLGGDNTVEACTSALVKAAREAHIPLFANTPTHIDDGALFGLGADYTEVGRIAGRMAADILHGKDPATMQVNNVVPQQLAVNLQALHGLKDHWSVDQTALARADRVIDANGVERKSRAAAGAASGTGQVAARKWRICVIDFIDSITTDDIRKGLFDELPKQGLVEGRDYEITRGCAQGDAGTLSGLVDAALTAKADMVVPTATPALQATINKVKDVPVVFTGVASGVLAGAGKSERDHMPNVTGITTSSDFDGMVGVLKQCLPRARTIGTLFAPSEINSVFFKDALTASAHRAGLQCVAVPVAGSHEVSDAAGALAAKVDAVCQISDHVSNTSFTAISGAARQAHVPIFGFSSGSVTKGGAAVAVARDYDEAGRSCAALIARVIRGSQPAAIPFEPLRKTALIVSRRNATACGLQLPGTLVSKANKVVD